MDGRTTGGLSDARWDAMDNLRKREKGIMALRARHFGSRACSLRMVRTDEKTEVGW